MIDETTDHNCQRYPNSMQALLLGVCMMDLVVEARRVSDEDQHSQRCTLTGAACQTVEPLVPLRYRKSEILHLT